MTPGERAEVRRLEVDGPYKESARPQPITDTDRLFSLMALLLVGSGTYLYYNPEAWKSFAVGFLIVFISSMTARRQL